MKGHQILKADPGWHTVWGAKEKDPYLASQIIAWLIELDETITEDKTFVHSPIPITMHGCEDNCDAICDPEGRIEVCNDRTFNHIIDYKKYLNEGS